MKNSFVSIRRMRPDETELLQEFLYHAIYLPEGTEPPPRSVVDLPELRVYTQGFGTRPGDFCLVAEVDGQVTGAAWAASWRTTAISTTIPLLWPFPCSQTTAGRASEPGCWIACWFYCRSRDINECLFLSRQKIPPFVCTKERDSRWQRRGGVCI